MISDTPDDAGHLGDFVYATGETDCDYLLYGPGFSRSRRPREKEIVGAPYRNEKQGGNETLSYVERFPWLVCVRDLASMKVRRHGMTEGSCGIGRCYI
jgi:hypothetical protein